MRPASAIKKKNILHICQTRPEAEAVPKLPGLIEAGFNPCTSNLHSNLPIVPFEVSSSAVQQRLVSSLWQDSCKILSIVVQEEVR